MSFGRPAAGAALICIVALGACAPQGMGPRQEVGIVSGALLGGTAGHLIGGGDGASILAGALLGGIIGGAVGADLDEQERIRAARAEFRALDTGRPTTWQGNRADIRGEVIPGPRFSEGRQLCREYTHTIYIGGRPQEGYGTACRQPDGAWRIVS